MFYLTIIIPLLFSQQNYEINLISHGNNILQNTNNLRTRVINDLNFNSDSFTNNKFGLENISIYI